MNCFSGLNTNFQVYILLVFFNLREFLHISLWRIRDLVIALIDVEDKKVSHVRNLLDVGE